MFEIDYSDPEVRRILAQYEDVTAQFESTADEITVAYHEQAAKIEEEHQARIEENREFYERLEQEKQQQDQQPPSPWTAPQRETVMSFGEFEDEQPKPDAWSTPTPPMGFPPAPPIPEPVPEAEAIRSPAPEPVMSFGGFDDDDPAPPVRQPPQTGGGGRRRARDEDDEDMSGQSWLR
ncbi:hypothetical protein KIPE111705_17590 [Kibdelosporangium persicum]|uniref:Uncharacterized protein n=1 Tax=Kibdelosporangium persicum TaxID=2698649 RepID=A0ABX2F0W3_9PSEU|nr:hypothetical protein [Kibdelosporangium persicum]NRN64530.1 hypothetical protein [Kibdelosporangium persicum]